MSLPPVILFFGARVSHEVKCPGVGQRLMSVPISAMSFNAVYGPMESIWVRSAPRKAVERIANLETGFVVAEFRFAAWGRNRHFGSTLFRRERTQEGFDLAVTSLDLPLESVKELEVLAQYEKMFGTIVARQRCSDLLLPRHDNGGRDGTPGPWGR